MIMIGDTKKRTQSNIDYLRCCKQPGYPNTERVRISFENIQMAVQFSGIHLKIAAFK